MCKYMLVCLLSSVLGYYSASAQDQVACSIPSLCNDATINPRMQVPSQGAAMPSQQTPQFPQPNIVTPTQPCPAGYIQCRNIKCGVSSNPVLVTDQSGNGKRLAFPWHAFIQDGTRANDNRKGYAGGGVLISPRYVVTAAHKVLNLTQGAINVLMGVYSVNDNQGVQSRVVSSVQYHSGYDRNTLKNDIAILQLQQSINLDDSASLLCLPTSGRNYQGSGGSDGNCWVAGFGQTGFSLVDAPHSLKQIKVPVVTNQMCQASFQGLSVDTSFYLDFPGEICAGGEAGVDACTQDGGSGLVCRDSATSPFSLVGLVNWGKNCGRAGVYGVYVNVPNYVNWINGVLTCYAQGSSNCNSFSANRFY